METLPTSSQKKEAVRRLWPIVRKAKTFKRDVFQPLCNMAGKRQRCMYCEDSRDTDVEHFWPKAVYPEKAFKWFNLLLGCSGCQRAKGDRFPLDDDGQPLLINPTSEDPWDHLFFVPQTGFITPRYDAAAGQESVKGQETLRLLSVLNHEAVIEGRLQAWRNLQDAVRAFLAAASSGFPNSSERDARHQLTTAVLNHEAYGLAQWFFRRDGQEDRPFSDLRQSFPEVSDEVSTLVA